MTISEDRTHRGPSSFLRTNPVSRSRLISFDKLRRITSDHAERRKALGYNRVCADDAILTQNQLAFRAEDDCIVSKPRVAPDRNAASACYALGMNGRVHVRVLVIVVHEKNCRR